MNLVQAVLERSDGGLSCRIGSQTLDVPPEVAAARPDLAGYAGRRLAVGIRPEAIEDAMLLSDTRSRGRLRGVVRLTEALGSALLAHVQIEAQPVVHEQVLEGAADDEVVAEELRAEERKRRTTIVCSLDPGSSVQAGADVDLALDSRRLHFFDLETGEAIAAQP